MLGLVWFFVLVLHVLSTVTAEATIERVRIAKSLFVDWDYRISYEPEFQEFVDMKNHYPESGSYYKVLTFKAFGKDWTIEMEKNNVLLAKNAMVETRSMDGGVIKTRPFHRDCYYIGRASAGVHEDGWAAFTFCNGKTAGYIVTNINDYLINPMIAKPPASEQRKRDVDFMHELKRSLMESAGKEHSRTKRYPDEKHDWNMVHFGPEHLPNGRVLHYEIAAMMDDSYKNDFYAEVVNSEDELILHIEQIFLFAQLWYIHPSLGFQVWLTLQKLIFLDKPFEKLEDPWHQTAMTAACKWQGETFKDSKDWDDLVMFSNRREMWGGLGGVSFSSGACSEPTDHCCGVAAQGGWMMSTTSRTVAHELAHGLGMPDDYRWPMSEFCYTGLMRSGVYEDHDWARCSVQRFENFLNVNGTECVHKKNTPSLAPDQITPGNIPVNVAWRAKVEQSSTNGREVDWGAWHATDGAVHGLPLKPENATLGSCTMTKPQRDPWIKVTLENEYANKPIEYIHIYNRDDCCSERLHDFEVRIGNDPDHRKNQLCSTHKGAVPGGRYGLAKIKCDQKISGKYVSVEIKGDNEILTVCEIFVFQLERLKEFVPPTECRDNSKHCPDWKFSKTCEDPSQAHNNKRLCQYTCEYCQRPNQYPQMKPDSSVVELPKIECVDGSSICWHYRSNDRCARREDWCPRACKIDCGGDTVIGGKESGTGGTDTGTETGGECVDKNKECPGWANFGECEKNPVTVQRLCPLSCGKCKPTVTTAKPEIGGGTDTGTGTGKCVDTNKECPNWAKFGECEKNPVTVQKVCPLSCGKCKPTGTKPETGGGTGAGDCVDKNTECPGWANYGECEKNPVTVKKLCPKSCGIC
ncbi:uncharacterized protein LOC141906622 [Tubulanus polymorphus]|uniref:uncharacterized protein LOC141906622 n=1 Tax=Tubulanus polymorphus TaxID=672921 RepID=UPI003DA4C46B